MIDKMNHHYSFTNPATIHDEEALTSLELAGRTVGKVNEVVESQNTLKTETDARLKAQDKELADRLEVQDTAILYQEKTVIPNTVKTEVDKHIADGDFDDAIDHYAGELINRLDNLAQTVSEGSTTGDVELADIRTGANGVNYVNAGTAVRQQLNSKADKLTTIPIRTGKNLFNKETATLGKYLSDGGVEVDSTNSFVTDYIPIKEGVSYTFNKSNNGGRYNCYYADIGGNPIGSFLSDTTEEGEGMKTTFTPPEGARYVRISHSNKAIIDAFQVEEGTKTTVYSPYIEYKPLDDLREDVDDVLIKMGALDYLPKRYSRNLFNKDDVTLGYFLGSGGQKIISDSSFVSEYIPVKEGVTYSINNTLSGGRYICFFKTKESTALISYSGDELTSNGVHTVKAPTGANFARISHKIDFLEEIQFEEGDIITPYEDYTEYKPLADLKEEMDEKFTTIEGELNTSFKNPTATAKGEVSGYKSLTVANLCHVKKNECISFYGEINSFEEMTIGHGIDSYSGSWCVITPTSLTVCSKRDEVTINSQTNHGLTLSGFIGITIHQQTDGVDITISTNGGSYTVNNVWWEGTNGNVKATANNNTLILNSVLAWTSSDLSSKVWIFGDSYLGLTPERFPYYLLENGFDKWLGCGYGGAGAAQQRLAFNQLLKLGTPAYAVFTLGMNDLDGESINSGWVTAVNGFLKLCDDNNVTPILATIPNVPERDNTLKNEWVRNSGRRYVDFEKAVGSHVNPMWYDGMLSDDNLHPAILGAKALYQRFLVDVPEIMAKL